MYGIYIVLFGWLLNIPLVFLIYFFIAKPLYKHIKKNHNRYKVFALSCTILIIVILTSYIPGWLHFNKLCNEHADPVIGSVNGVTYYYIDGVNPNGPFLELNNLKRQFKDKKISFIEGPNIYRTKYRPEEPPYLRYNLTDEGEFEYIKISNLQSSYGYRQIFNKDRGIHSHIKEVYRFEDSSIVSKYITFDYLGGYLNWLTYPFGIQECPDYGSQWYSLSHGRLDLRTFNMLERE